MAIGEFGMIRVPECNSDAFGSSRMSKLAKRDSWLKPRSVIGENEPKCERFWKLKF